MGRTGRGPWLGRLLGRSGAILLIAAIASIIVDVPYSIIEAHFLPIAVAAITTAAALLVGYLIGGPIAQARHTIAITGAMRNVGLALSIATINNLPPAVDLIIIVYALVTILIVTAYTRRLPYAATP